MPSRVADPDPVQGWRRILYKSAANCLVLGERSDRYCVDTWAFCGVSVDADPGKVMSAPSALAARLNQLASLPGGHFRIRAIGANHVQKGHQ